MYTLIIILPLLSATIGLLTGRLIGEKGMGILGSGLMIGASILSLLIFKDIIIDGNEINIEGATWMDIGGILTIKWGLKYDSLTATMLIVVLIVSTLVHVYSIEYMSGDPHKVRFISYLSLFTFFMLILVTASNYLQLFIGWEGKNFYALNDYLELKLNNIFIRKFFSLGKGISSLKRIGPHNNDFLSFLIGSLLGDCHLEKRTEGCGTRIIFEQCQQNMEYLYWYHKYLVNRGYCPDKKPYFRRKIGQGNKVFYSYRINSYTFSSFNWLHDLFYPNKIKCVPKNQEIWNLFTPLSLAIWYMDDGSRTKSGAKFATNNFEWSDIEFLCNMLKSKFKLETSIHSSGPNKGFTIYIKSESWPHFKTLIEPHVHPCMKYKLEKKILK